MWTSKFFPLGVGGGEDFHKLHVIFDYCLPVISMNASFQSKKNLTSKQLFPPFPCLQWGVWYMLPSVVNKSKEQSIFYTQISKISWVVYFWHSETLTRVCWVESKEHDHRVVYHKVSQITLCQQIKRFQSQIIDNFPLPRQSGQCLYPKVVICTRTPQLPQNHNTE